MTEELPLVSVIVPCYNHEKYVVQAIESIVNQSYQNIQLIVIDDGSKDGCPGILQQLSKEYGFFYEQQNNEGLAATLNKAITNYVNGKYISICASDDFFEADKIKKQVAYMEYHPSYGMCHGKCKVVDENGKRLNRDRSVNWKSGRVFKEIFFFEMVICAPSVMIRKKVFDDIGMYNPNIYIEDWYMWLKISKKYKIGFIDEYLTYYRSHDNNISSNRLRMTEATEQIFDLWEDDAYYEKAYAKWAVLNFRYLASDYKRKSLRYAWVSKKYFYKKEYLKGIKNFILE